MVFILPWVLIGFAVVVILWTLANVLRHGLSLRVRNSVTGNLKVSALRILMWWMFSIAVPIILWVVSNDYRFFGIAFFAFFIGGILAALMIRNTASEEYELTQSRLSLRATAVAAAIVGVTFIVGSILALAFYEFHSLVQQYSMLSGPPLGAWLIANANRLWRKAKTRASRLPRKLTISTKDE